MKRWPCVAVPLSAVVAGIPDVVAPGTTVAHAAYSAAFCAFVGLAWLGVGAQHGRLRVAYALMASAQSVWLCGDLLYWILTKVYGDLGPVSPCDVLWVLGYPLLAAGLIMMVRLRAAGRLREAVLDGLAMATAVAGLFWQSMILPEIAGDEFSLSVLFSVFYPFGDVLLFTAGALLVLSPGGRRGPTRYLILGLVLTFAADVVDSATQRWFPSFNNERMDAVLLLANGLLAVALWHPDGRETAEPRRRDTGRLHPVRTMFLGAAMLALPALVGFRSTGLLERMSMLVAMTVLTVFVLIRFTLVVREQEMTRSALAERASRDELTGLANRQELHARLSAALESDPRGPVVHFLDLNGFKAINDRYGHRAGDAVLVEIGQRLLAEVRATDTVARLGGDEFVVMSAGADTDAGMAERFHRAVGRPVSFEGHELVVGVAVGTAAAGDLEQPTPDALLAAADAAMYFKKAASGPAAMVRGSVTAQPRRTPASWPPG